MICLSTVIFLSYASYYDNVYFEVKLLKDAQNLSFILLMLLENAEAPKLSYLHMSDNKNGNDQNSDFLCLVGFRILFDCYKGWRQVKICLCPISKKPLVLKPVAVRTKQPGISFNDRITIGNSRPNQRHHARERRCIKFIHPIWRHGYKIVNTLTLNSSSTTNYANLVWELWPASYMCQ